LLKSSQTARIYDRSADGLIALYVVFHFMHSKQPNTAVLCYVCSVGYQKEVPISGTMADSFSDFRIPTSEFLFMSFSF
jgi:hypothetical protein